MSLNNYKYIAIEGNIGAGKSTLAGMLAAKHHAAVIMEEFEDNSFLPKFYAQPERYAFPLEMSFLAARFNQLKKQLLQPALFNKLIISDYIFSKCLLFSKVNLNDDEYNLYNKLFEIINMQLPHPDLLIYLHHNIERIQYNIKTRGRPYELNIEDNYLLNLQNAYLSYLQSIKNYPVLIIDCTYLDFVNNPLHFNAIEKVFGYSYNNGITHINPAL